MKYISTRTGIEATAQETVFQGLAPDGGLYVPEIGSIRVGLPKFLKYYNNKPEKKDYNFDEVINYLVKYSKIKGDLESIMMAFYFVCKEIKFDKECYNNNEETKFNQKPINVYDEGMGVSSGFTNLFEYILK
ncbi:MAG: hypothetical protein II391_05045, partial [Kiritimatiellae bacterium]|nr:hypothetical protein [Kiritimatiellia bacterium]